MTKTDAVRSTIRRSGIFVFAVAFAVLVYAGMVYSLEFDWWVAGVPITMLDIVGLLVAMLPALIILQHTLDLYFRISTASTWHIGHIPEPQQNRLRSLLPAYETAAREYRQSRSFRNLMISYGLPALFTFTAAVVVYYLIRRPWRWGEAFDREIIDGMRLGAVGAYVYVLLHLTQRYFQRDITTGGATWCAANLLLGPLLGGLLAHIWNGDEHNSFL